MLNSIKKTTLATIASVAMVGGLGVSAQAATTQPTSANISQSPLSNVSGAVETTSNSTNVTLEAQNRRGFKNRRNFKRSKRGFNNRHYRSQRFNNRHYKRGYYNRGFDRGYYGHRGHRGTSFGITIGSGGSYYGRGSYGYRY